MNSHSSPLARTAVIFLLLVALHLGIVVHIVLTAPPELSRLLFSEDGSYETMSVWLWLLLALATASAGKLRPSTRLAASAAALLMAAREMDLHKALFDMSFIKTGFYKSAATPFADKLAGGTLLLLMLALTAYLAARFIRHVPRRLDTARLLVLLGLATGIISKIMDRLGSQLRAIFDIHLAQQQRLMITGLEESMEMLIPVLLILALICHPGRRSA